MVNRYTLMIAFLIVLINQTGCNRNDAECLSRAGQKVAVHAKGNFSEIGGKVDVSWPGVRREPTLHEKIHDRLRFDKLMKDATLEVHVKDKEVELKGTIANLEQRQRAIELAESVVGVEKVTDASQLREPMVD